MKFIVPFFMLALSLPCFAELVPINVSPVNCSNGAQFQPEGRYAIYVFCDDALGSNVAIFLHDLGGLYDGKYKLGKRFWQGEEWAYDVTSFYWLPNKNHLLIATSGIYGSGSLYILNVSKQEAIVLYQLDEAVLQIVEVKEKEVLLKYEKNYGEYEFVKVAM